MLILADNISRSIISHDTCFEQIVILLILWCWWVIFDLYPSFSSLYPESLLTFRDQSPQILTELPSTTGITQIPVKLIRSRRRWVSSSAGVGSGLSEEGFTCYWGGDPVSGDSWVLTQTFKNSSTHHWGYALLIWEQSCWGMVWLIINGESSNRLNNYHGFVFSFELVGL